MSNEYEAQAEAGWEHAKAYEGDGRQDIKADVFNAFQAGIVWERRRAVAESRPDTKRLDWLDAQWQHGVHVEVVSESGAGDSRHRTSTVYFRAGDGFKGAHIRDSLDAAIDEATKP